MSHKEANPFPISNGFYVKKTPTSELVLCTPYIPNTYTHMGEMLIKQWLDIFKSKTVAGWKMEFTVVNN